MPSPFPGMDPYLEGHLWTTVHTALGNEIARQLSPKIRPRYVALPTERFVMEMPGSVTVTAAEAYPDVAVSEAAPAWPAGSLGQAVAETHAPLQLATVVPAPVPHVTVEILTVADRELVTAIEVLSPTNKRGEGRREYLTKRQRTLVSTAHLMEIDFLRLGQRVPMQQPLPPAPYFVILSRFERRPLCDVWPIALADTLPTVPVPLLPGDADVMLELQLAFTTVYDGLNYDLLVDYGHPAEIPLQGEAELWADERLRAAGARRQAA